MITVRQPLDSRPDSLPGSRAQPDTRRAAAWLGLIALLGFAACGDVVSSDPDVADEASPWSKFPGEGMVDSALASPSTGCQTTVPPGTYDLTIRSSNVDRKYRAYVPPGYRPGTPAALVLSLHGLGGDINAQVGAGLNAEADLHKYVIAYPQGLPDDSHQNFNAWNAGSCCGRANDVQFMRDVVTHVKANLCIDGKRVYAAGFSMGAFMVQRLACEASDVFAAVISNSGSTMIRPAACLPAQPVSVLEIHGAKDYAVCWGGNTVCNDSNYYASIPEDNLMWRTKNRITSGPTEFYRYGGTSCQRWANAAAAVELCRVAEMGHCWAGLPGCTTEISMNTAISAFTAAHVKP